MPRFLALLGLLVLCRATPAPGGQDASPQAERANVDGNPVIAIHGPPAPAAPAVVARDAQGRVTVRAVRLEAPLRMDGKLDDRVYTQVPSFSDFVQQEPREGQPASEKTENTG